LRKVPTSLGNPQHPDKKESPSRASLFLHEEKEQKKNSYIGQLDRIESKRAQF
jgi:hypothetical protein